MSGCSSQLHVQINTSKHAPACTFIQTHMLGKPFSRLLANQLLTCNCQFFELVYCVLYYIYVCRQLIDMHHIVNQLASGKFHKLNFRIFLTINHCVASYIDTIIRFQGINFQGSSKSAKPAKSLSLKFSSYAVAIVEHSMTVKIIIADVYPF